MRDRLLFDGNVISENPVELESLVHLEPLPARKCDHLRQDGVRETGGHRVPAHHLRVKFFAEPFVGTGASWPVMTTRTTKVVTLEVVNM